MSTTVSRKICHLCMEAHIKSHFSNIFLQKRVGRLMEVKYSFGETQISERRVQPYRKVQLCPMQAYIVVGAYLHTFTAAT